MSGIMEEYEEIKHLYVSRHFSYHLCRIIRLLCDNLRWKAGCGNAGLGVVDPEGEGVKEG